MRENTDKQTLTASSIDVIAAAAHNAHAAYCRSLGEDSQVSWDDAQEWQRKSAINGVNFYLDNPDADASASHANWRAQKEADGWTYGEKKDPDKKVHPCLVDFDKLPAEQQFKDSLFHSLVHSLTPSLAALEPDNSAAAEATETAMPAKPRKFGKWPDGAPDRADLMKKIRAAGTVELAFLDENGTELPGVHPRKLPAKAFRDGLSFISIDVPELHVHGPVPGGTPHRLGGYALLHEGKKLAMTKRIEPLPIGPGATFELKHDVIF